MSKISIAIRARKQNYTTLRAAFRSESGAIDLASIMVGIIVIGLIGGVIAATVFAVIPWAQDNAAKEQLESIHKAENAFYGLSADPAANLTNGLVNTFTNSANLDTAGLLKTGLTYCVIGSDIDGVTGQDYKAYSKSASGKIWTSSNNFKKAEVLIGKPSGNCMSLEENVEGEVPTTPSPDPTTPGTDPTDTTPPVFVTANRIALGYEHSAVLDSTGEAWAWGDADFLRTGALGELGLKSDVQSSPIRVDRSAAHGGVKFVQIESAMYHSLALTSAGKLYSWGYNNTGQLGINATSASVSEQGLTAIVPAQTFKYIAVGGSSSYAIDTAGNIWSWGNDASGQLGNGTSTANVIKPTLVVMPAGIKLVSLSASGSHVIALDESGNAWAWGGDSGGELGNNAAFLAQTSPVAVQMPVGVTFGQVMAGSGSSYAIDIAGNIWGWGSNNAGALGVETPTVKQALPIQITNGVKYKQIEAGNYSATALDVNGKIWAWGQNNGNLLGVDNTAASQTVPALVKFPTDVVVTEIGMGYTTIGAYDTTGQLWIWGEGSKYQLATATPQDSTSPIVVTGFNLILKANFEISYTYADYSPPGFNKNGGSTSGDSKRSGAMAFSSASSGNKASYYTQDVFEVGKTYTVSAWFKGSRSDKLYTVGVQGIGTSTPVATGAVFGEVTYEFTATSTSHTVVFNSTDTSNIFYYAMDDITIIQTN